MKVSAHRRTQPGTTNEQDWAAFLAFLQHGQLGPIHPGLPRARVIELLGIPSDTSNPRAVPPPHEILWYGPWLELGLTDGVLDSLSLRYKWQRPYGRRLRLSGGLNAPWARTVSTWGYARFRTHLHSRGIGYFLTRWYDGSLTLDALSGSIVLGDSRRMGLYSINYVVGAHRTQLPTTQWTAPPPVVRWTRRKAS